MEPKSPDDVSEYRKDLVLVVSIFDNQHKMEKPNWNKQLVGECKKRSFVPCFRKGFVFQGLKKKKEEEEAEALKEL